MARVFGADEVDRVAAIVRNLGKGQPSSPTVVLIDGGSGAGKTTFATSLSRDLSIRLVSLDECYPGWYGLDQGAEMIPAMLGGDQPGFWRWDWEKNRASTWQPLPPHQPLIIEGCGAIRPSNVELATACIWFEVDAALRKQRALARDGDRFASWWNVWAAQEHVHWMKHRPRGLADVIITQGSSIET